MSRSKEKKLRPPDYCLYGSRTLLSSAAKSGYRRRRFLVVEQLITAKRSTAKNERHASPCNDILSGGSSPGEPGAERSLGVGIEKQSSKSSFNGYLAAEYQANQDCVSLMYDEIFLDNWYGDLFFWNVLDGL